jgi:hypothetical protein
VDLFSYIYSEDRREFVISRLFGGVIGTEILKLRPLDRNNHSLPEEKVVFEWGLLDGTFLYCVKTHHSIGETAEWFEEYAPRALRCHACGGIIFPNAIVAKRDGEFLHGDTPTCSTIGYIWGRLDDHGDVESVFGNVTYLVHALRTEAHITEFLEPHTLKNSQYVPTYQCLRSEMFL